MSKRQEGWFVTTQGGPSNTSLVLYKTKQNNDALIIGYLVEKWVTESHLSRHYSFLNIKFNTYITLKIGKQHTAFPKHNITLSASHIFGHAFANHTFQYLYSCPQNEWIHCHLCSRNLKVGMYLHLDFSCVCVGKICSIFVEKHVSKNFCETTAWIVGSFVCWNLYLRIKKVLCELSVFITHFTVW